MPPPPPPPLVVVPVAVLRDIRCLVWASREIYFLTVTNSAVDAVDVDAVDTRCKGESVFEVPLDDRIESNRVRLQLVLSTHERRLSRRAHEAKETYLVDANVEAIVAGLLHMHQQAFF